MKESDKGLLAVAVFIGIFYWSKNVKGPEFGPPERVGPRRGHRLGAPDNSKGVVVTDSPVL